MVKLLKNVLSIYIQQFLILESSYLSLLYYNMYVYTVSGKTMSSEKVFNLILYLRNNLVICNIVRLVHHSSPSTCRPLPIITFIDKLDKYRKPPKRVSIEINLYDFLQLLSVLNFRSFPS